MCVYLCLSAPTASDEQSCSPFGDGLDSLTDSSLTGSPTKILKRSGSKMLRGLSDFFKNMLVSKVADSSSTSLPTSPVCGAANRYHSQHVESKSQKLISLSPPKTLPHMASSNSLGEIQRSKLSSLSLSQTQSQKLSASFQQVPSRTPSPIPQPLLSLRPASQLLSISPTLPVKMHRDPTQWKMSDYTIMEQIYKVIEHLLGWFRSGYVFGSLSLKVSGSFRPIWGFWEG